MTLQPTSTRRRPMATRPPRTSPQRMRTRSLLQRARSNKVPINEGAGQWARPFCCRPTSAHHLLRRCCFDLPIEDVRCLIRHTKPRAVALRIAARGRWIATSGFRPSHPRHRPEHTRGADNRMGLQEQPGNRSTLWCRCLGDDRARDGTAVLPRPAWTRRMAPQANVCRRLVKRRFRRVKDPLERAILGSAVVNLHTSTFSGGDGHRVRGRGCWIRVRGGCLREKK